MADDSFPPPTTATRRRPTEPELRLRSGSVSLSDSSGWTTGRVQEETSDDDGSLVDIGQGLAEIKDAKVPPWAEVDADGNVQPTQSSPARLPRIGEQLSSLRDLPVLIPFGPEDENHLKQIATQRSRLDRLIQRPAVANATSSNLSRGAGPPQARRRGRGRGGPTFITPRSSRHRTDTEATPELVSSSFKSPDSSPSFSPASNYTAFTSPGSVFYSTPPTPALGLKDVGSPKGLARQGQISKARAAPVIRVQQEIGGGKAPPGTVAALNTGAFEGQRRVGRCKNFSCDSGIGFIVDDDLGSVPYDVKFHWTDLFSDKDFASLSKGEIVEYTLNITPNGYSASYVTGPRGRPVMGADASTIADSRERSLKLFKSRSVPSKNYKSKWKDMPTPSSFLGTPTPSASPTITYHSDTGGSPATSSSAAFAGLGIDMRPSNEPVYDYSAPPPVPYFAQPLPYPFPPPFEDYLSPSFVHPAFTMGDLDQGQGAVYHEVQQMVDQRNVFFAQQLAMTAMLRQAQARSFLSPQAPAFQPSTEYQVTHEGSLVPEETGSPPDQLVELGNVSGVASPAPSSNASAADVQRPVSAASKSSVDDTFGGNRPKTVSPSKAGSTKMKRRAMSFGGVTGGELRVIDKAGTRARDASLSSAPAERS